METHPQAVVAVVDTETTGLPHHPWAEVIELAAVALDAGGAEVATFSTFVSPVVLDERAAPALRVNGLQPSDLHGAPGAQVVAADFRAWLAGLGGPSLTSYNVAFDCGMLQRMGLGDEVVWRACLMHEAHAAMGSGRRGNLAAAAAHFGVVSCQPAHRALSDARTAAGIYRALHRPPAVEIRIFFAHGRRAEDVEGATARLQAYFERRLQPGQTVQVVSAKAAYEEGAAQAGGWDAWTRRVGSGTRIDGAPTYHGYACPDRQVGKATATILSSALAAGRTVRWWDALHERMVPVLDVRTDNAQRFTDGWSLVLAE